METVFDFTERDIEFIRKCRDAGVSWRVLADSFPCTYTTLNTYFADGKRVETLPYNVQRRRVEKIRYNMGYEKRGRRIGFWQFFDMPTPSKRPGTRNWMGPVDDSERSICHYRS